jgi:hypothetical protein
MCKILNEQFILLQYFKCLKLVTKDWELALRCVNCLIMESWQKLATRIKHQVENINYECVLFIDDNISNNEYR